MKIIIYYCHYSPKIDHFGPKKNLSKIKLEHRFRDYNSSNCLMTVDGTDFIIPEPSPFNPSYFSYLSVSNGFQVPGLRRKVPVRSNIQALVHEIAKENPHQNTHPDVATTYPSNKSLTTIKSNEEHS